MALMTVPADYLDAARLSPLGVVLAHGADADASWRGPLLERLAVQLARQARRSGGQGLLGGFGGRGKGAACGCWRPELVTPRSV